MRSIWKRKWLVLIATVVVFLSVGAVAWATTSGGSTTDATETAVIPGGAAGVTTAAVGDGACDETGRPGAALRKAVRGKVERWAERQKKLMDNLRGDMTAEDQALYDGLVQKAKDQRQAVQDARSALADTLKQLHDLADKYLDDGES